MTKICVNCVDLKQENAELKARVAELEQEIKDWVGQYGHCDCGHPACSIERDRRAAESLLNRTPAQSLETHNREVAAKALEGVAQEFEWSEIVDVRKRLGWVAALMRAKSNRIRGGE